MQEFQVNDLVVLSADEEYPEEWARVLWRSPEDPMLYVCVVEPHDRQSPMDHGHRLVAADCMFPR